MSALDVRDIPHARSQDPGSSKESSLATELEEGPTSKLRPESSKHLALSTISLRPSTANEVERATGKRGIWKRVSDLKNAGLVEPIGETRDTRTNRVCEIMQATERGERVLRLLNLGHTVSLTDTEEET